MKITENSTGTSSAKRVSVSDTAPSQGFSNVSQSDDMSTNMNAPELHKREWRTDQLVEMAMGSGRRYHAHSASVVRFVDGAIRDRRARHECGASRQAALSTSHFYYCRSQFCEFHRRHGGRSHHCRLHSAASRR